MQVSSHRVWPYCIFETCTGSQNLWVWTALNFIPFGWRHAWTTGNLREPASCREFSTDLGLRTRATWGPKNYMAPAEANAWIGQIFLGLEHMHLRMNTLLSDLKPDNVVLSSLEDVNFHGFSTIWLVGLYAWQSWQSTVVKRPDADLFLRLPRG